MISCPFARLGLLPDADLPTLQAAWRRLARAHHPDLHPGDPHATAVFQEMAAARDQALAILQARAAATAASAETAAADDQAEPVPPAASPPSWRARAAEPRGWRARTAPPPPWRRA